MNIPPEHPILIDVGRKGAQPFFFGKRLAALLAYFETEGTNATNRGAASLFECDIKTVSETRRRLLRAAIAQAAMDAQKPGNGDSDDRTQLQTLAEAENHAAAENQNTPLASPMVVDREP